MRQVNERPHIGSARVARITWRFAVSQAIVILLARLLDLASTLPERLFVRRRTDAAASRTANGRAGTFVGVFLKGNVVVVAVGLPQAGPLRNGFHSMRRTDFSNLVLYFVHALRRVAHGENSKHRFEAFHEEVRSHRPRYPVEHNGQPHEEWTPCGYPDNRDSRRWHGIQSTRGICHSIVEYPAATFQQVQHE